MSGRLAVAIALWKPRFALRTDRRGTVVVMTAMLGTVLIGTTALATDVGVWKVNKNAMQGAADQAALAAGFVVGYGSAVAQSEAKGVAAAYGFVDGTNSVAVTVAIPPSSGSHAGNANMIQVTIAQPQQSFLSGMFLPTAPTVSATAVAGPPPATANTCLMALKPTGAGSITIAGAAFVDAKHCNVYDNSNSSCDVQRSSNFYGSVDSHDAYVGEPADCGGALTAVGKVTYGALPTADPYANSVMPTPGTCITPSAGATTFSQGTYCKDLSFSSQSVTFNPGIYVFDRASLALTNNSTLAASGVSLVFTSSTGANFGSFSANGNSPAAVSNLTAMTTGATAGIAIWIDKRQGGTTGTAVGISAIGTPVLDVEGAMYAPGSAATWDLLNGSTSKCTQLIAYTIAFDGYPHFDADNGSTCVGMPVNNVPGSGNYKLAE